MLSQTSEILIFSNEKPELKTMQVKIGTDKTIPKNFNYKTERESHCSSYLELLSQRWTLPSTSSKVCSLIKFARHFPP